MARKRLNEGFSLSMVFCIKQCPLFSFYGFIFTLLRIIHIALSLALPSFLSTPFSSFNSTLFFFTLIRSLFLYLLLSFLYTVSSSFLSVPCPPFLYTFLFFLPSCTPSTHLQFTFHSLCSRALSSVALMSFDFAPLNKSYSVTIQTQGQMLLN